MGAGIRPVSRGDAAFERQFIREAIDREYLIFLEHDPLTAAGCIREKDGRRYVERVRKWH